MHRDSEVAWLSETCLLPQKVPGAIHSAARGVKFVRSVILVVLAPKGSWSYRVVLGSSQPTAKCRQDKPPNTQTSVQSSILARKMKVFPANGHLQDLHPSLPSLQYCQGRIWARTTIIRSPDNCEWPSTSSNFAFYATLQMNAECPNTFRVIVSG